MHTSSGFAPTGNAAIRRSCLSAECLPRSVPEMASRSPSMPKYFVRRSSIICGFAEASAT